jgi:hypothetical protein
MIVVALVQLKAGATSGLTARSHQLRGGVYDLAIPEDIRIVPPRGQLILALAYPRGAMHKWWARPFRRFGRCLVRRFAGVWNGI